MPLCTGQPEEHLTKLGRQERWQRPFLGRLDHRGEQTPLFDFVAHSTKHDRLSYASKPEERDAPRRATTLALQRCELKCVEDVIPPGELRRLCAGARSERVVETIHDDRLYTEIRRFMFREKTQ